MKRFDFKSILLSKLICDFYLFQLNITLLMSAEWSANGYTYFDNQEDICVDQGPLAYGDCCLGPRARKLQTW